MPRNSPVNRGLSNATVPVELAKPSTVRCAIYTRKSTEEGLQQEFNSLDAQREAAEAFIRSQKHEGWELLPDLYGDGGYTGGNMDTSEAGKTMKDAQARVERPPTRYPDAGAGAIHRTTRFLVGFCNLLISEEIASKCESHSATEGVLCLPTTLSSQWGVHLARDVGGRVRAERRQGGFRPPPVRSSANESQPGQTWKTSGMETIYAEHE